jgi:hypothetical protein
MSERNPVSADPMTAGAMTPTPWARARVLLEGEAMKVRGAATLRRVADASARVYGWRVTIRDGAFHDTEGAPTAGPPPYDVYEAAPTAAFGSGTDETFVPTRWRFGEPTT